MAAAGVWFMKINVFHLFSWNFNTNSQQCKECPHQISESMPNNSLWINLAQYAIYHTVWQFSSYTIVSGSNDYKIHHGHNTWN